MKSLINKPSHYIVMIFVNLFTWHVYSKFDTKVSMKIGGKCIGHLPTLNP